MIDLIDRDDTAIFYEKCLDSADAMELFEKLKNLSEWRQEKIKIFGKHIECPSLTAWFGDKGITYSYSGVTHVAAGWPPFLLKLRDQLQERFNVTCNSVLCNHYRDGSDDMGWYSDIEKEIATDSSIISVSLGTTRAFQFRHKATRQLVSTELKNGSVLIMGQRIQQYWQHRLPKNTKHLETRINLTFRNIIHC